MLDALIHALTNGLPLLRRRRSEMLCVDTGKRVLLQEILTTVGGRHIKFEDPLSVGDLILLQPEQV